MAPNTTLLLYLALALVALAHGYPFDDDDFQQDDGVADILDDGEFQEGAYDPRQLGNNVAEDDGDVDELSAQDRLLAYYERDRRGARWNKNFVGISSLDRSITAYTSFLPCRVEGICKQKFKQTFRCKCNRHTYCVGPGKKYEARCRYSAVGHVFYQP